MLPFGAARKISPTRLVCMPAAAAEISLCGAAMNLQLGGHNLPSCCLAIRLDSYQTHAFTAAGDCR